MHREALILRLIRRGGLRAVDSGDARVRRLEKDVLQGTHMGVGVLLKINLCLCQSME
jgi:hypothetical protein